MSNQYHVCAIVEAKDDFDFLQHIVKESMTDVEFGRLGWLGNQDVPNGAKPEPFFRWAHIEPLRKKLKIKRHAKFKGLPIHLHAEYVMYALMMVVDSTSANVVVLLHDTDNDPEWCKSVEQAKQEKPWPFCILSGAPHPMIEAWLLLCFIPKTQQEIQRLEAKTKQLGFDPTQQPERLLGPKGTYLHPKDVWPALAGSDKTQQAACWRGTSLDHLRQRGESSGLRAFLGEITTHLLPLVSGAQHP